MEIFNKLPDVIVNSIISYLFGIPFTVYWPDRRIKCKIPLQKNYVVIVINMILLIIQLLNVFINMV